MYAGSKLHTKICFQNIKLLIWALDTEWIQFWQSHFKHLLNRSFWWVPARYKIAKYNVVWYLSNGFNNWVLFVWFEVDQINNHCACYLYVCIIFITHFVPMGPVCFYNSLTIDISVNQFYLLSIVFWTEAVAHNALAVAQVWPLKILKCSYMRFLMRYT